MREIDEFHFYLEPQEAVHPVWTRIRDQLRLRLESRRAKLETPKLSAEDTAFERGYVKCLRAVLEFENRPRPEGKFTKNDPYSARTVLDEIRRG